MATLIVIIWTIGLAGALVATVVILKLSQLVIRALIDIAKLGRRTETAAQGIASNVSIIPTLPNLGPPSEKLTSTAQQISRALDSLSRRIAAV